ncbi:MAG: thioredoxin-disulfide reductase [Candidatus Dojkabacteria bacterium]|nr:thioredoxin-disulfide reductase [Candidatus Dojkabacteria bacterium]
MNRIRNVIIIGSGPAGYTAALYTARANLEPILISGRISGGQLMLTSEVENFPGFPEGILGPQLMDNMRKQAERFGCQIIEENVIKIEYDETTKTQKIITDTNQTFFAKTTIIATGASARWLEIPSEEKYKGRGVSTCATCDGAFYRNKTVAVVGGGDSAMEEALFLSKLAQKVYIIHRRDAFRASKIMQDRVFKNPKIEIIWNNTIKEFRGDQVLRSVVLESTVDNTQTELAVDGVFLAIGHIPNTEFVRDLLETDEQGYIVTQNEVFTNKPGIFAAGDVVDHRYRQAITAAGSGCKAALEVEKYLISIE